MRFLTYRRSVFVLAVLLVAFTAEATTVKQMDLGELTRAADKIFRGRVLEASPGTVAAGGGQISTVIYRVYVEEAFHGTFPSDKETKVVELQMLGKFKNVASGPLTRVASIPLLPNIQVGETYLFMTTVPSSRGLTTTVGLGQGLFHITSIGKYEFATNEFNNIGLFKTAGSSLRREATGATSSGSAITYTDLAQQIRALTGGR